MGEAGAEEDRGGHYIYVVFFTINYLFGAGVLAIPHVCNLTHV